MGERRVAYRILVGERDHLGKAGGDGRIILRWILSKQDVGSWSGLIWFRKGTGGGHFIKAVMNFRLP
jgi:hypothetical protein